MKFNSNSFKGSSAAYKLLFIFSLSVSLASCQWGDQIESLVQTNPDDFNVTFSDTASVQLSTVVTDSVMTGGSNRMLVGRIIDPYFGKIQVATYFQPNLQSGVTIGEGAIYDSLIVSLAYDAYSYGDTTKPVNLSVHRLQEDMSLQSSIYNTYAIPFDAAPLGTKSVLPRPVSNRPLSETAYKLLKIRLSDALGKEVFDKAKSNLLTSNTDWLNIVKGLVLRPSANYNASIISFQTPRVFVQMHYHFSDIEGVRRDSTVFQSTALYNQILADRTGTPVASLGKTQRVAHPSAQTGNMSFIQAGLGTMTRIDLPTVRYMRYNKYTVANKAALRITPIRQSVTDQLRAPNALYVYRCDNNNQFYLNSNGFPLPLYNLAFQQPTPIIARFVNDLINNKQYYLVDVSSYVTELLTSESGDVGGLLLRTSQFNEGQPFQSRTFPALYTGFTETLDRLVIGDQQNQEPGVKLELYYTRVQTE